MGWDQDWSGEDFKKVFWMDESKFETYGSKRRIFLWCRPEEKLMANCVVPTVKYGGGSIIVWRSFSSQRSGYFVHIEEIMKKEQNKLILKENSNWKWIYLPTGQRSKVVQDYLDVI